MDEVIDQGVPAIGVRISLSYDLTLRLHRLSC